MRLLLAITFGLIFNLSFGQVLTPVKWKTDYKQVNDKEFDLIFTAKIDDGWAIYSQYLESDDGPVRTTIEYDKGDHYKLVGKNKESDNQIKAFDELFGMNVIKFKKTAVLTQRVSVSDLSKPITGYLTYMTCDDTRCLPPTDFDFDFKLKSSSGAGTSTGATPAKEEVKKVESVVTNTEKAKDNIIASANNAKDQIKNTTTPQTTPAVKKTTTRKTTSQSSNKANDRSKQTSGQLAQKEEEKKASDDDEPAGETIAQDATGLSLDEGKTHWTATLKKVGEEYDLIYDVKIKDGFNIYSHYVEEGGPIPTSIFLEDPDKNATIVGKLKEESSKREEGFDKVFEMNVTKLKKDAQFTQRIKLNDATKPVKGYIEYMVCDHKGCVKKDIEIYANVSNAQMLIGDAALKAKEGSKDSQGEVSPVNIDAGVAGPKIVGNEIDQTVASIKSTYKEPIGNCGEEDVATGQNLWWTFILGFLGGLVALLTPCVFPMIPLTVSYFTKGSKDRKSGIRNGLIYGASIIVIYVAIGLIITGVFGATALQALSTNWIANTLFFLIFVFFAFSFFGFYELTLPSSWTNKSDAMADKGGLVGTFFMAFTLALVSFSCTGPIIGSALVSSATSAMGPFIVMLGFSTALALPFGLFAAFPAWLNSLPRSGSWMNSVKVVLGFLELGLALKFLSVADMTMHWGILPYEIFLGAWVLLAAAMTLYLFGYIKFPHDSPVKKLSPVRMTFGLLSLATTLYLCTGFMYNDASKSYDSLNLLSGVAPPAHYNLFLDKNKGTDVSKAVFKSYSKCAQNIDCFKDYYEGLAYAKQVNKPVFIDFTGHGCVNCRRTEEHIWVDDDIKKKLSEDFVLISLYTDDRADLDQHYMSVVQNKKLRNIGNKWGDFQIANFDQNSQPLYVMMTPDAKVLAAPRGYKEGIEGYNEFLDCGLQTYQNYKRLGSK